MNRLEKLKKHIEILALAILIITEFTAHRFIPFMMDDLWYGTNLVTGEKLHSFQDVVESMVWHFYNWGGRCMTHGVLQLTLMSGELCADIMNVTMTLLLTFLVCIIIRQRKLSVFLIVHSMIFSMNANVKMSMLWQSGTANYVYSSVWILVFIWPYMRALQDPEKRPLPLAALWLMPIGLLAGWSNENMGPACFLAASGITVYLWRMRKKPAMWMFVGVIFSLAGSVLVVAAPGNFLRSGYVESQGLWGRLMSMLTAGTDYLMPTILPMVFFLLLKGVCLRSKISKEQWVLLAVVVLSYGAMILSPHYPDRATFGTMVFGIALLVSALQEILSEKPRLMPWMSGLTACYWVGAMARLLLEISYVS